MLLHGYNPSNGSFTGTSKFSNPVMEEVQKGAAIIVDVFTFIEDQDLYIYKDGLFVLSDGWQDIKAGRDTVKAAANLVKAKTIKIAAIDAETAAGIIEIVGDAASQRNLLASYLNTKNAGGLVTTFELQWKEVEELRASGNEREALIADALDIEEVESI